MLSLSFSLLARSLSAELTIDVSHLEGLDGRLLHPELHVVHRWVQSGIGVFQGAAVEVGELLLKDDRVSLRDGYRRRCSSLTHIHRSRTRYVPPDVRLTGPVTTQMGAGITKQFWISLEVPGDAAAGTYRGFVVAREGDATILKLEIVVEVLPIALLEPKQDLMLWYRGTLNCHHPQHYVSAAILEVQLRDIYRHGFRSISLWETDPAQMQRAVDIAQTAGFHGNVMLDSYSEHMWSKVDFGRLTPVAYVSDKLDAAPASEIDGHIARFDSAHAAGVVTMASVQQWQSRRQFSALGTSGDEPDIVCVYAPANLAQLELNAAGKSAQDRATYYYWQAHMEKPLVHRLLAGVLFWKSGAEGISPYCYQHLPGTPWSPFDDFDAWEPVTHKDPDGRVYRDHMTTYPARKGVIPTVQWKGMADGLTDFRYMVTLDAALVRAERSADAGSRVEAAEIRRRLVSVSNAIPWTGVDILSSSNPIAFPGVGGRELHAMRVGLMKDLIELLKAE